MRQLAHVAPYVVEILLGMNAVGGKHQFGGEDVVAHAVVQLLGYALTLALESVDVALLLVQQRLLCSDASAIEHNAHHS